MLTFDEKHDFFRRKIKLAVCDVNREPLHNCGEKPADGFDMRRKERKAVFQKGGRTPIKQILSHWRIEDTEFDEYTVKKYKFTISQ